MHFNSIPVIDVHVLALCRCEEGLIVQELDVSGCFLDLPTHNKQSGPGSQILA